MRREVTGSSGSRTHLINGSNTSRTSYGEHGSNNIPPWNNGSNSSCQDVTHLPIELRRLEEFEDSNEATSDGLASSSSVGLKSQSLGDILAPTPNSMVRSRSSVPSLTGQVSLY